MIEAGKPRVGRFLMPCTGGGEEVSYLDIAIIDTSTEGGYTILYDITTTDRTAAYVKADLHQQEQNNVHTWYKLLLSYG